MGAMAQKLAAVGVDEKTSERTEAEYRVMLRLVKEELFKARTKTAFWTTRTNLLAAEVVALEKTLGEIEAALHGHEPGPEPEPEPLLLRAEPKPKSKPKPKKRRH